MKKTGLTLGKFAPFHKGHQYIIETAQKETDELFVLIYDTDVTEIPLPIRAKWIKELYPSVKVIEAWGGPVGYSRDREYQIKEENFILEKLDGKKITHFYSSEFYGEHVSRALGAKDRRIDEDRAQISVSGTMIRENPFQFRQFLSPVVYRDLITKVVFLGAMSTGKSTLTEALARKYNTSFAGEYGRDYWAEHQVNRRITFEAFDDIARGHIEREEKEILNADKYFFIDTNAITTYMYALDYHGKAPEFLKRMAEENSRRYDLFFLCDDDIPYDDTWDRSGDQKRHVFQKQIIADLLMRNIPFIVLSGTLEERIIKVEKVLSKFRRFDNYYGKEN